MNSPLIGRMWCVAIALSLLVTSLAAAAASEVSKYDWAADARKILDEAKAELGRIDDLNYQLSQAGMPPEDSTPQREFLKWERANPQAAGRLEDLKKARKKLLRSIMKLWIESSIGEPVIKRKAGSIVEQGAVVVVEYERILQKLSSESFPSVFHGNLYANIMALRGPYYRQASQAICTHIAEIGIGPLPWHDPAEVGSPLIEEERTEIKAVFAEWYFHHLQYGVRWDVDSRSGKPVMRPANAEVFGLIRVELGEEESK